MRTATAPHKQLLQPVKLRDAPDGVYEGVGCARQQSEAARNDSRGVFMNSKLRPSSTKTPKIAKLFRVTRGGLVPITSAMATSPTKKGFSPKRLLFSSRMFCLFLERSRNTFSGRENYVPVGVCVRHWAQKRAKKGKKDLDSSLFAYFF